MVLQTQCVNYIRIYSVTRLGSIYSLENRTDIYRGCNLNVTFTQKQEWHVTAVSQSNKHAKMVTQVTKTKGRHNSVLFH